MTAVALSRSSWTLLCHLALVSQVNCRSVLPSPRLVRVLPLPFPLSPSSDRLCFIVFHCLLYC